MNVAYKYDILSKNHNDYDISIERNKMEEIRNDPFGLGNTFKGLMNVSHEKNLHDYAQEIVANYAKYDGESYCLTLSNLPDDEQNELARLLIESLDREVNECIYGNDFTINNEFTCALLELLKNDNPGTRRNFAEVTLRNILIYYKDSLQTIIDEACTEYLHNLNNQAGYYAHQDMEHGDIVWRKM